MQNLSSCARWTGWDSLGGEQFRSSFVFVWHSPIDSLFICSFSFLSIFIIIRVCSFLLFRFSFDLRWVGCTFYCVSSRVYRSRHRQHTVHIRAILAFISNFHRVWASCSMFDVCLSPIVVVGIWLLLLLVASSSSWSIPLCFQCIVSSLWLDRDAEQSKAHQNMDCIDDDWHCLFGKIILRLCHVAEHLSHRQQTTKCKTGVAASDKPFWFSSQFFFVPFFIRALISRAQTIRWRTKSNKASNTFRSCDWVMHVNSSFPCRACQLLVLRVALLNRM